MSLRNWYNNKGSIYLGKCFYYYYYYFYCKLRNPIKLYMIHIYLQFGNMEFMTNTEYHLSYFHSLYHYLSCRFSLSIYFTWSRWYQYEFKREEKTNWYLTQYHVHTLLIVLSAPISDEHRIESLSTLACIRGST